jgi:hypothetical protein
VRYRKIALPDRPFVLHVFHRATASQVAIKLNRCKNKAVRFKAEDFELDDFTDAQTHFLDYSLPGNYVIIFEKIDIETIAHEVWHVVMDHANYIGIKHDKSSEESFAYMFGYLIKQIHEFSTKGS